MFLFVSPSRLSSPEWLRRVFLCAEQVQSSCSRSCILLKFHLCQPIFNIRDASYMSGLRLVAGKEAFSLLSSSFFSANYHALDEYTEIMDELKNTAKSKTSKT